jgi:ArsR family transcriptional regulator, arsenate/arsenite/antimonite-responsive transcriptional repressor
MPSYRRHLGTACERCGFDHLCQLEVHHVDLDRTNNTPVNLGTLCANCHTLLHRGARDATARGQPVVARATVAISVDMPQATMWARKFKVLADPTRVAILFALADFGSARVSELTSAFDLSQPTVSHHLRLLREAGFVSCIREGTCSSYRLVPETMEPFQALLRVG